MTRGKQPVGSHQGNTARQRRFPRSPRPGERRSSLIPLTVAAILISVVILAGLLLAVSLRSNGATSVSTPTSASDPVPSPSPTQVVQSGTPSLSPTTTPPLGNPTLAVTPRLCRVRVQDWVRSEPSDNSVGLDRPQGGTELQVIGSVANAEGRWYRLANYIPAGYMHVESVIC